MQNIFLFDWDDTIMFTSYLYPDGQYNKATLNNEDSLINKLNSGFLQILENQIIALLTKAISNGHTYIITNANSEWIEQSSKLVYPNLVKILKDTINISARSWFEKEFPESPKSWKKACFEEIGKVYDSSTQINLIVIGDGLNEMEAAYEFAKNIKSCFVKTIKLKKNPTPYILYKQFNLLLKDFSGFLNNERSFSIIVKKKKNKSIKMGFYQKYIK